MKKILRNIQKWIVNPKKMIDKTLMGSITSQIVLLLFVFLIVFGFWLSLSNLCFKEQGNQINKDIPSRPWSILAQMVDPGNQHMIGKGTPQNAVYTYTIEKIPQDSISSKEPKNETIILQENTPESIGDDYSEYFWFRLFVFLISITGTIIFTGLLVSTITNIFERRVEKINAGLMNYRLTKHRIIIGFDNISIGLIKQILSDKKFIGDIVVQTQQSISGVKEKVYSHISNKEQSRIFFMFGSRDKIEEIQRLSPNKAEKIYILGENEGLEYERDSKNIACFNIIEKSLSNEKIYPIDCYVLFENPTTFTAFQFGDIINNNKKINFYSFNFHESWAQKLFAIQKKNTINLSSNTTEYIPLDYKKIDINSNNYVHLVILGMSRMGKALAIEAARLGHYPNYEKKKTKITFIDQDAERQEQFFRNSYETFYQAVDVHRINTLNNKKSKKKGNLPFINIELEFITGTVESLNVRDLLTELASDPEKILTIAICFNNAHLSLSTAMYLPNIIFEKEIPILVRQESDYILTSMLKIDNNLTSKYKNLIPFGNNLDFIDYIENCEWMSKCINYYYYHSDEKFENIDFNCKDQIENTWKGIRERDVWSNRYNVQSFETKLRAVKMDTVPKIELPELSNEQIELLARMEHARWNVERLLAGFWPARVDEIDESTATADLVWDQLQKCDFNIDDVEYIRLKKYHEAFVNVLKDKKFHPCIIPFDQLSEYYINIDRKLVMSIPKILKSEYERK